MEFQKSIIQFVIATLPAVVLYFVGWGYLYFFFTAFGINIAEIHLDTSTVFIYAFSPLLIAAKAYRSWGASVTLFAVIVAVVLFITKLIPHKHKRATKQIYRWLRDKVPFGVKTALLIIGLLIVLSALVPVVEWAAIQKKKQVWAGERPVSIVAMLVEGSKPKTGTDTAPQLRESYVQCSEQQALLLIFSDEKAYYLLCKSVENSNEGYVFEVRREFGLSSVRFVSAGDQQ